MKRRAFLPFLLSPALAKAGSPAFAATGSAPDMKITRIDTTYFRPGADLPWQPNWVWVRLHTNTGLVGLGETYPRNEAEASMVHSSMAGMLLGRDPRDIDRIWADLLSHLRFSSDRRYGDAGAERHRSGAVGPFGEIIERSGLPPVGGKVQSRNSPLQHLLWPPLRLQQRAGKDHA